MWFPIHILQQLWPLSSAICEIFSVKEWRNLKIFVRSRSRSLKMAPFDRSYTAFCWSAIESIALTCTIFSYLMLNNYHNIEIWVKGYSKSLKQVPFKSFGTASYLHFIISMVLSCIISEIKWDTGRKSQFFHTRPAFDALIGVPRRKIAIPFGTEKLEWCVYPTLKKV